MSLSTMRNTRLQTIALHVVAAASDGSETVITTDTEDDVVEKISGPRSERTVDGEQLAQFLGGAACRRLASFSSRSAPGLS
jgi:hypothetical protein